MQNTNMSVAQIRQEFLNYFKSKGHEIVASSSLIPHNDPTLLFTNAGMNQFKDLFLGLEKRSYTKAVTVQKCVRAGGKHNDLENVGYTARHHTFFEMLGNFSFGEYFKQDAIKYAWEFLTQVLKLPKDKLYVTVYHTDDDAYDIWHKQIGLDNNRIISIGDKPSGGSDNFWQMGDTGPCGPCTEIFYDHGEEIFGGLPGSKDEDGDRYTEIWNCVFMQYNWDQSGKLNPLPKPSVDTGMGLERISAVMQNVHSNYDIDLFKALINQASQITACKDLTHPSLKVLADHIRSVGFLIADGVIPSNEGRGYVLRRIMRRAIRHGYKLGKREPFFHKLFAELVKQMSDAYPELNNPKISQIILNEEDKFFQTLERGITLLESEIDKCKDQVLSGEVAFKLYDTYGFPLDLTQDICREVNIEVDLKQFELSMQKQQSQSMGGFKANVVLDYKGNTTNFKGYSDAIIDAKVMAIFDSDGNEVQSLSVNQIGTLILDQSVFYPEGGGQIGDVGIIQKNGGIDFIAKVSDTQKIRKQVIGHIVTVEHGEIKCGDEVSLSIDLHKRLATTRNHSVTHLLHKALSEVLGTGAAQKGSLVCSEYTRFDFAYDKPLTPKEIEEIERIVNHVIMMNYEVTIQEMPINKAKEKGAFAMFGEKYDEVVRVVQMGDFSIELCGGTHVKRTGDIGFFTIVAESGIASGVRRIEAITGEVALKRMQSNMSILDKLRDLLKAQSNDLVITKVEALQQEYKDLQKEHNGLKSKLALSQADSLLSQVKHLPSKVQLLVSQVEGVDEKSITDLIDKFKQKLGANTVIALGFVSNNRANLVISVSKDLITKYSAGNLINQIAPLIGGKGGGKPELARAGGDNPSQIANALKQLESIL